ncbi:MAG: sel1 repeat family protein [Bacteroidales bacterium]|nr:sel1 repeat family protein [Bacteroidales bacterium]
MNTTLLICIFAIIVGVFFAVLINIKKKKKRKEQSSQTKLLYAIAMKAFSSQKYEDAVKIFMFAGTQGSTEAMNMLGVCYENGCGVPVLRDLALKYYTLAAEAGNSDAQFNLGRLYYIIGNEKYRKNIGGVYVEIGPKPTEPYEEDVLALKWMRLAAEQGSLKAQFGMGELLMEGNGVDSATYEEGRKWMKKAASAGFKPAIDYVDAKKL